MENQLLKVEKLSTSDIMTLGKVFAESGMFQDTKSIAQAVVKIQAGQEIGIPPFASMTGIHIIKGKPTIGAGLIAARIKGSGKYDYRVIEQTDNVCSIDFYQGKQRIGNSTFSINDAKKAQTQNLDKFPRNMLFARAISNGVKWYCPDVFSSSVYVPEEMEGIETTYTEVKSDIQQLQERYFNLISGNTHVFSKEEQETYVRDYLNWNEPKIKKAVEKLEILISERTEKLLSEEQAKINNSQERQSNLGI